MTVTIKKNVDVQATLEVKQLKYQVKRDLSGDVQFTNTGNANPAWTIVGPASTMTATATRATNTGINFFKPAKIQLLARLSAMNMGSFSVIASGLVSATLAQY